MAEYWKSTPKYWCKFCKVYVRDSAFEKQQHDATPRHQSSIQRSLRDLHRSREREDREKQRAKDEVARLNGIIGESSGAPGGFKDATKPKSSYPPEPERKATAEERKAQIAKLAEMGVAIPEEYRREMAMAGDWEILSEKPLDRPTTKGEDPDAAEATNATALSVGVRKRKLEDEEEEESSQGATRKGWGSTFKTYPGSTASEENLEALFSSTTVKKPPEFNDEGIEGLLPKVKTEDAEECNDEALSKRSHPDVIGTRPPDAEGDDEAPSVVFKKRKVKILRPR